MAGLIYKLQNIVNTSPDNNNTDISIARCLLKNTSIIKKKTSLQDLSNLCFTSPSSMSRFSHKLGYTNFNDFKNDIIGIQEELNETILDNNAFQKINFDIFLNQISNCFKNINSKK